MKSTFPALTSNNNSSFLKITPHNKKLIDKFINIIGPLTSEWKKVKHRKNMTVWSYILEKDFEDATKEDISKMVSLLKSKKNFSEHTYADYIISLKYFYRIIFGGKDGKEYPECVSHITSKIDKSRIEKMSKYGKSNYLNEEDILNLIRAAKNSRDKSLIGIAANIGCRPSELIDRKFKNLKKDDYGYSLELEQPKMKDVRVPGRITWAAPYLDKWLNEYPNEKTPESFLFPSFRFIPIRKKNKIVGKTEYIENHHISVQTFWSLCQSLKAKTKIQKPVTPYAFRHAFATINLNRGIPFAIVNKAMGHNAVSRALECYTHIDENEVHRAMIEAEGIQMLDDKDRKAAIEKLKAIKCQRCGSNNPGTYDMCQQCGTPLKLDVAIKLETELAKIREEKDAALKKATQTLSKEDLLKLIPKDELKKMILDIMTKRK